MCDSTTTKTQIIALIKASSYQQMRVEESLVLGTILLLVFVGGDVCMVTNIATVWINRVRLPILLMVS